MTHQGLSTGFVAVYRLRAARLVRVRIPECCGLPNTFAYGGIATDFYRIDCAGPHGSGLVVRDGMHWIRRHRWRYDRTVYRLESSRFIRKDHTQRTVSKVPAEFGAPLLGRCGVS
jgi:hypothetical protein